MPGIFINYRRKDSSGYTGRLAYELGLKFDGRWIFFDLDQISPGADFVDAIEDALNNCQIVLAIIGPHWEVIADSRGVRRLDKPDDPVVVEIATALESEIRIIPVLVGGASMPVDEVLPSRIKSFSRKQAHEISDKRWTFDVEKLIEKIELVFEKVEKVAPQSATLPPPSNTEIGEAQSKQFETRPAYTSPFDWQVVKPDKKKRQQRQDGQKKKSDKIGESADVKEEDEHGKKPDPIMPLKVFFLLFIVVTIILMFAMPSAK